MTLKESINIIEEYANIYNEKLIHPEDCEAFNMALSSLRSEYMEEQAGADQKAYDEKAAAVQQKALKEWEDHDCCNCKHAFRGLFEQPCVECDGIVIRSKWEADL